MLFHGLKRLVYILVGRIDPTTLPFIHFVCARLIGAVFDVDTVLVGLKAQLIDVLVHSACKIPWPLLIVK